MYQEKRSDKPSPKRLVQQKMKPYKKPTLTTIGTVAELTLGRNGSRIDGRCTSDKSGQGIGTPKHCQDRNAPLY